MHEAETSAQPEKKDKTSLKHSIGSIRSVSMGSADDMEQGGTSSNFKKQLNSYVFRRRLSFAGIGIALIGVGAIVTFVVMHMNGKSLIALLNLRALYWLQAK